MKYCVYILVLAFFSCKQEKVKDDVSKVDIEKEIKIDSVKEVDIKSDKNILEQKKDSLNPWIVGPNEIDLFESLSDQQNDSLLNTISEYFNEYKIKYKSTDTIVDYYFVKNNVLDIEFNYSELSKEVIENSLIFKNDSVKFEITKEKFNPSNYKISRDGNGYTDLINNKIPYGIDGGLPKSNIKSMDLYLNNNKLSIKETNFEDLFEPNFKSAKLYLTDFNELIFTSWNSDGAGGYYLVLFINQDGKISRIISMP